MKNELTPAEFVGPLFALMNRIAERPHSVFFYPAGLYDWEPLRHFGDLCDTFIYCDVAISQESFGQGLDGLLAVGAEKVGKPEALSAESLGLGVDDRPWFTRYMTPAFEAAYQEAIVIVQQHGGPWGRQITVQLGRKVSTICCFRAEAFRCFLALFARHNVAPKVVCLKSAPGHRRFLDLDMWAAPLGRAVADSPQPELLVTNTQRQDDWPWQRVWQQYPAWGAVAYWRQHPITWPVLPPAD